MSETMPEDPFDEAPVDAEKIQDDAKKRYSLRDRIRGSKRRTKSVIIFFDMVAAEAYGKAQAAAQQTAGIIENLSKAVPENDEQRKLLDERIIELSKVLEEQQAAVVATRGPALDNSAGLTLTSVPEVAWRSAQRKAKAQYEITGAVPQDLIEDYQVALTKHTLMQGALDSIRFPEDDEGHRPTEDDIEAIVDELDPSQFARVDRALNRIMFEDGLEKAATDEPGF